MFVSRSALSVFCCLLLCAVAGAQVTITENDVPRTIGDSFLFKICFDSTTVSVGAAGGPHVWSFDTTSFPGGVVGGEIVDKDSTPLGSRFPDANVVVEQVSGPYGFWSYRKLDASHMLDLGIAMSNADTVIGHVYDPSSVNLTLPLTFGTQWQTIFGYTDTTSDSTQTVVANKYECSVDAWGTATCPAGTYPCLRENVFQTEIAINLLRGVTTSAETALTRRFFWHAAAVGAVAMAHSMEGDTSSSFTMADDYMVLVQTNRGAVAEQCGLPVAAHVRILPNPCAGSAALRLAPGITGPVTVRVCDAVGRVVLRQVGSSSEVRLDLRGNPAGLYICTVTAAGRIVTNEFVLLQ